MSKLALRLLKKWAAILNAMKDETSDKIVRYSYCSGCGNWITATAWEIMSDEQKKAFSKQVAKDGLLVAEKKKSEWEKLEYGCKCGLN